MIDCHRGHRHEEFAARQPRTCLLWHLEAARRRGLTGPYRAAGSSMDPMIAGWGAAVEVEPPHDMVLGPPARNSQREMLVTFWDSSLLRCLSSPTAGQASMLPTSGSFHIHRATMLCVSPAHTKYEHADYHSVSTR